MTEKGKLMMTYKSLHPEGKRPSPMWSAAVLEEKIRQFREADEAEEEYNGIKLSECSDYEEYKRKKEAFEINSRKHKTINEIVPVFIQGKPFAIIDDKYVPWQEAEIIILQSQKAEIEKKIAQKQRELNLNPK